MPMASLAQTRTTTMGLVPANVRSSLQSYWFVKSEQLGKVSVGMQSQASDNTAILVDGSGSLVSANWVAFDSGGFFIRQTNGSIAGSPRFIGIGCGNSRWAVPGVTVTAMPQQRRSL